LWTEDCCIFRVNTIRHEESTEAQNKAAQEHYGRKMTMFLGRTTKLYDPKNLTSNLQELEGINICFSHKSNWWINMKIYKCQFFMPHYQFHVLLYSHSIYYNIWILKN
jgi:hypothetical protein